MSGPSPLRVGTRGSVLAQAQTRLTMAALQESQPGLEWQEVVIETEGDRYQGALHQAPTPGIFVSALRDALLRGDVDCVVHSMKDLPGADHPELALAAAPPRESPVDVLVTSSGQKLADLPAGATVGTSSPRRAASVKRARPDLQMADIRGNITTRIEKVRRGDYAATILAKAGLVRAGLSEAISEELDVKWFLPAPRQGILALEVRAEDASALELIGKLDHRESRLAAAAEQGVLLGLEAGCHSAVGGLAQVDGTTVRLQAELADPETGEVESVTGETQSDSVDEIRAWAIQLVDPLRSSDLATKVGLS